ncbi:hypothetical protein D3C87_1583400 [compost metagenome]
MVTTTTSLMTRMMHNSWTDRRNLIYVHGSMQTVHHYWGWQQFRTRLHRKQEVHKLIQFTVKLHASRVWTEPGTEEETYS